MCDGLFYSLSTVDGSAYFCSLPTDRKHFREVFAYIQFLVICCECVNYEGQVSVTYNVR